MTIKIKSKIISILLITVICLCSLQPIYADSDSLFSDIEKHWAKNYIYSLVDKGIIEGYPDGTFKPNKTLTKAEAIKLLITSLDKDPGKYENGHWATYYYKQALNDGYVLENEMNDLDSPVIRGEMARILSRAITEQIENIEEYKNSISDFSSIPKELQNYVLKIYALGIITGYTDGDFKYNNTLTRAEASTMLVRFLEPTERIVPELIEETPINIDFKPEIDREKIIEELRKYPTDYPDEENYTRPSEYDAKNKDITYANKVFIKYWERDAKEVYEQTADIMDLLFDRDYRNISKTYKDDLIRYFRTWWTYNGEENHTPDSFVNAWIKETKDYKIKQEAIFVTDKSLGYISNEGVKVRGRLYFRYLNHEKPDNISFELEKENVNFEVGKWYSVDVDVEWGQPFSNVPYSHKPARHVLFGYSNYLSDFSVINE